MLGDGVVGWAGIGSGGIGAATEDVDVTAC